MISQDIYDAMRAMPVFKPEMRKANRDGLKSQTRRVMMPQPFPYDIGQPTRDMSWKSYIYPDDKFAKRVVRHCPYGDAGEFCYMREPMVRGDGDLAYYKDDGVMVRHFLTGEAIPWRWNVKTLSGMFMPKEAARSLYRYESIWVERVQDITEEDAFAEGVVKDNDGYFKIELPEDHAAKSVSSNSARGTYQVLFDHINLKRGFGWDSNPWVWVLAYEPVMYLTSWNVGSEIHGLHADFIILDDPMDERFGDEARKAFENMFRQNFMNGMNRNIKTIGPWRFDPDKKGGAR